jgi:trans-aconitate 2-methyltransferase
VFGGEGNIAQFEPILIQMMQAEKWRAYFKEFSHGWWFPDNQNYKKLVQESGLKPVNVALVPKDMIHDDRLGLEGWIRTTWHPYLRYLPNVMINEFIRELVDLFLEKYPLDLERKTHVDMVRLEVEAIKGPSTTLRDLRLK